MFKAGAKCFRSCDNEVLVLLIAVYGMGCEEWNRSEPGPGSSPAAEETIALMSRVLAVVPGAGVASALVEGVSVETWSCSRQLVTAPLRSPAFRVSRQ